MKGFVYLRPSSLEEVFQALKTYGDEAKVMAGGQSLLILMREGLVQPQVVVSLQGVSALGGINFDETAGVVEVGGLATHREVGFSALIREKFPLMADAYQNLASVQVRNLGTLAGNLCHNAPGSDPPAPLIALDARVTLAGPCGQREMSVEAFGTDFYETALREDEILTKVSIPLLPPCTGSAYKKIAIRATDMAIAGVAVRVTLNGDGNTCEDIRIALSGVAPTTICARQAEEVLRGQGLSEELIAEAGRAAQSDIDPISDAHASAEYRRKLVPAAVRHVVTQAWSRARGAAATKGVTL